MGSRLGVIVVSESGQELYYDHWAAQTIGIDVAVDGFAATLARVRSMEPMGVENVAEWEGAAWIEGSLLIDITRRLVAWAEESDYLHLPRIVNHLIEQSWPGWTAVWSAEGVRGILWLAGVDPATIFSRTAVYERTADDLKWFVPWGQGPIDDGVVSVDLGGSRLISWRGDSSIDTVAEFGPALIRSAAEEAQARDRHGEPVLWDKQPRDVHPVDGVHISFAARAVRWWALGDSDMQIDAFDVLWAGWSVESIADAYELHEHAMGRPVRHWDEDVAATRVIVQEMHDRGPRENPIARAAAVLADRGEKIVVSPEALQFRPVNEFRGIHTALAALDDLTYRDRVPPARIVNRHGRVLVPDTLLGQR